MPSWMLLLWLLKGVWLLFALAVGGCIGSLINVLAYRMPLGISVVSPPSRCPRCGTRLSWRDNIPVFGWLMLRGRCRYCKDPISPEYPIVEAVVALLFGVLYAACFMMPMHARWLGIDWSGVRPEWALNFPQQIWPLFVIVLVIFGSLAAMTLVDAKTFTIPLPLAWFPAAIALIGHSGWGIYISATSGGLQRTALGWEWSIATPGPAGWGWVGASIGATLGLGIGLLLLRFGLISRSFDDYEEWEKATFGESKSDEGVPTRHDVPASQDLTSESARDTDRDADAPTLEPRQEGRISPATLIVICAMLICPVAGALVAPSLGFAGGLGLLVGAALGPLVGGLVTMPMRRTPVATEAKAEPAKGAGSPAEVWTQYPHARREMVREMAFLAPAGVLAIGGWHLANRLAGPWTTGPSGPIPSVDVPLWLSVLGGVLMGYLIGGGVVWLVRILGSLAFGKEAMGLGDVHLMAAVGACMGWIDTTLAFFLAAFVGVFWAILGRVYSGSLARAMPYGPFLAVATLIVFLAKPAIERALESMTGYSPFSLP
jgi:prepilin signal peptidase PulO-like enzyme (type II secretory pathway)